MANLLVLAPDALLRFRSGRVLLHTSTPGMPPFETDNPILIGWVCQFARPADPEKLRAELPASDRAGARQVLDYLRRSGVLVAAERASDATAAAAAGSSRVQDQLRALARRIHDLACDLPAMSP